MAYVINDDCVACGKLYRRVSWLELSLKEINILSIRISAPNAVFALVFALTMLFIRVNNHKVFK